MPESWRTRNYVGTIFGGSLYGALDPIMIMLIKLLGPEYEVWDKAASIRFRRPGRSTRGTPEYAALAAAVTAVLGTQVRDRGCTVFSSDLRVRVLATGLVTYPDVTVVCDELERDPECRTTVVNPTAIVEVTSDGTRRTRPFLRRTR